MIDGVHHHPAHVRSPASPARTPGLAARNIHMIDIADLTNRRETGLVNSADFAGRHFYQRITSLEGRKRRLLAGTARDLPSTARSQFDIVNIGSERNCAKRQRVAQVRRNIVPCRDARANLKAVRRENVTYFTIAVFNESNARRAIRVVLDADHFRRDAVFAPFEIDFAILLLVAAANVPRRQPTTVVAAAASFSRLNKSPFGTPLRNFIERGQRFETLRGS